MVSECLPRQRTIGCRPKCWGAIWPASSRACGWKALYASTTVYTSTTSHRTGLDYQTGIQIDKSYHFQIQCSELVKWLENQVHIRILATVRTIGSVLHVNWHQEASLLCVINVSHHNQYHHTYKGCFLVKFTNFSATYVVCGYFQWWLSDL